MEAEHTPSPSGEPNASGGGSGLRTAAVQVVQRLTAAGHESYFAGGCVRDRLLGLEPIDYDIATAATPEEVGMVFKKVQSVGQSFGVVLVRVGGHVIQVATFRTDGVYSDGRHPDAVTFSDAEHDAQRRDFTINGLFEDPIKDTIIDHVGGRADLQARLVRAIGDANARLAEDHLRMLRAVRFAAKFGFAIESETADAVRHNAPKLQGVSRERIGGEVRRMLSDVNRAVAAWELQYLGLDAAIFQEPSRKVAPTRLGHLPEDVAYPTALAAWILDRQIASGELPTETLNRWAGLLMLSNDEHESTAAALDVFRVMGTTWLHLGVAGQKRLAVSAGFQPGLQLLHATDRQAFVDVRRWVLELSKSGLAPPPFITGDDLIAAGLKPGPAFSEVLSSVYDAQLEGSVTTKPDALEMAHAVLRATLRQ